MAIRKKPKKADFVFEGKRYWIPECEAVDISDSDDPQAFFLQWITLDYETDERAGEDLMGNEEFLDKEYAAIDRLFPHPERELPWYEGY